MLSFLYSLMPRWARGLTAKIYCIVFLAILGIGAITLQASIVSKIDLEKSKEDELQHLVQTAITTISALHDDAKSGAIGEEQAKEVAKKLLAKLRYNGNEYFWINDMNHHMLMHGHGSIHGGEKISQQPRIPMACSISSNLLKWVANPMVESFATLGPIQAARNPHPKCPMCKPMRLGAGLWERALTLTIWTVFSGPI